MDAASLNIFCSDDGKYLEKCGEAEKRYHTYNANSYFLHSSLNSSYEGCGTLEQVFCSPKW